MEQETVGTLLEAMTLLQSVVMSCVDRKKFPFTRTQLLIFTVLYREGEMTMKQAARYIASSREQATRTVAPLVDEGYVERRVDPANRTRVYIRLTERGRQLSEENRVLLRSNLSEKLSCALSPQEKEELCEASEKIIDCMEKAMNGGL